MPSKKLEIVNEILDTLVNADPMGYNKIEQDTIRQVGPHITFDSGRSKYALKLLYLGEKDD